MSDDTIQTENADAVAAMAPDQTEAEAELTTLIGVIQREAEGLGWTSEVVQFSDPVILGLTAPSGRGFSLSANPTP